MQKTPPRQLLDFARAVGSDDIRRTHKGAGPNWYVVFDAPGLGCKASARWRNMATAPERRGLVVYWPFPEPGQWVKDGKRCSRLSHEAALTLVREGPEAGLESHAYDLGRAARAAAMATGRHSDEETPPPANPFADAQGTGGWERGWQSLGTDAAQESAPVARR